MADSIDPTIATLLARHYAGEASPEELQELDAWRAQDPERESMIELLRDAWDAAGKSDGEISTVDVRPQVWARVQSPAPKQAALRTPSRLARTNLPATPQRTWTRTLWLSMAGIAAAAALIVAGGQVQKRLATVSAPAKSVLTYTTANGQRANITLPDGSTASLNVASRLEVPADYARGNRALRLTGEALFTVAHQENAPFTVTTGPTVTRVLGTSFVVRRYVTDTATTVAVRDGKVAVQSVVLTADRQAEVGAMGVVHTGAANPARFSFATGIFTLDDMALPDAIVELNRWYDADIRLGDSRLATQRMKGKFAAGSVAELAAILELTFDVRVVRDERILTLFPQ